MTNDKNNLPPDVNASVHPPRSRIDVIIPAYNAQQTIYRSLCSIALQTIKDAVDVTIVDDCSVKGGYEGIADRFSPFLSVRTLRMERNGGPATARQYGVDHTRNPYITYLDADDAYSGVSALDLLRKPLLEDEKIVYTAGDFERVPKFADTSGLPAPILGDHAHVFAKMFRRSFLAEYDIRFGSAYFNEDVRYMGLCQICSGNEEYARAVDRIVYSWFESDGSLTASNNYSELFYGEDLSTFTDGCSDVVKQGLLRKVPRIFVADWAIERLCYLYFRFIECMEKAPEYEDRVWRQCLRYYKDAYLPIADAAPVEMLKSKYAKLTVQSYGDRSFGNILPYIGIKEFMEKLGSEADSPES